MSDDKKLAGGVYGIPGAMVYSESNPGGIYNVPRPVLSAFIEKYNGLQNVPKVILNQLFAIFKDGQNTVLTDIQREWLVSVLK